jgi:hypothetical protein
MKTLQLLLGICFFTSGVGFSQTSAEIAEWQALHSAVFFIEESDATEELIEKLTLSGKQVVIYSEEIKFSDLTDVHSTELKGGFYQIDGYLVNSSDADFVKNWMGTHQEIKLFTKSAADLLSEEEINAYSSIEALFLLGEIITLTDLKNYDYAH